MLAQAKRYELIHDWGQMGVVYRPPEEIQLYLTQTCEQGLELSAFL
jgi:hypothetical protein